MTHMLAALEVQVFRYPDLTFYEKLTFHGGRRKAELVAVAPAHTVCDTYLLLPADGIAFVGDLGFFQSQPFMAFCDPPAWQAWLAEAERWPVETFVPGHGPVGGRTDLALQREYLRIVGGMVAQAAGDGLSLDETLALPLTPPYDAWLQGGMGRWEANVTALYERATGNQG
jgi:glyoxylase-like metal-dependent hydrolase (beta-lactamase superfamily II)